MVSILVADDSPTIRRRATATLGDEGFDVQCAEDGEGAWALLSGPEAIRPGVILCDILMPKLDGYDLCQRIKGDDSLKDTPVMLLRGTFEPWDEDRAREAGADGFITKPFEPENLVSTVKEILALGGAGSGESLAEPVAPAPKAEPVEDVGNSTHALPQAPAPEPAAPASDDPFGSSDEAPAPAPASDDPFGASDDDPFGTAEQPAAAPASDDPFGSSDDGPLSSAAPAPAAAAPA
ncbi:MAG: response regulator, partial [Acidobacteriota bacterium]